MVTHLYCFMNLCNHAIALFIIGQGSSFNTS
uniref:Uncharacterized protein n=1 Tax=Anguilla anguilla TaxID=7936 RepID=A0A0E9QU60_ANGAN